MTATTTNLPIDWPEIAAQRTADLHAFAAENRVSFSDLETARLVAITLREDARRALAMAHALVATHPQAPVVRRASITSIGVAQVFRPDGPYLLLRRGSEAWLVPAVPNGWDYREPWLGDLNSVCWMGGPPAIAAFRRVGAPV